MHNFLIWLLKSREEPCEIAFLNFFHLMYLAIIVGVTIWLAYYLKAHKEKEAPTLRVLAYALVIVYIADFFIQPFIASDFTMNIDKLPFHVCTVLCPLVAFTEFNKRFEKIQEPVTILAIAAPLMYIVYPGSALGEISAFCYKVIQTFVYHGLLFAWGVINLASGKFVPSIKNWYKTLIEILLIAVWATFGNFAYNTAYAGGDGNHHYDWFFLTGSSFSLSPYIMPFLTIAAVFGTTMCVYGLYYAYIHIASKREAKKAINNSAN